MFFTLSVFAQEAEYNRIYLRNALYLKDTVVISMYGDTLINTTKAAQMIDDSLGNVVTIPDTIYVLGQDTWVGINDTIYLVDTSNYALNSLDCDNLHAYIDVPAPNEITCSNASVTMNGTSNQDVTFAWTGPESFSTASAVATIPGEYTLTVTNSVTGCTADSTYTIVQDISYLSGSIVIDQLKLPGAVQLTGRNTSNESTGFYWWEGTGITDYTIGNTWVTSTPGTYEFHYMNLESGCSDNESVVISTSDFGDSINVSYGSFDSIYIADDLVVDGIIYNEHYEAAAYLDPDSTVTTSASTSWAFLGGGSNNKFTNIYSEGFSFDGDTLTFDQDASDPRDSLEFRLSYSSETSSDGVNETVYIGIFRKKIGGSYTEIRQLTKRTRTSSAGTYYPGPTCTTMPLYLTDGDKIHIRLKIASGTATISTQSMGIYIYEE